MKLLFCGPIVFSFFGSFMGIAQNEVNSPDESNSISATWLEGKWEGSGYGNSYFKDPSFSLVKAERQKFEMSIKLTRDSSLTFVLVGSSQKGTTISYIVDEAPTFIYPQERASKRNMRFLFLDPYREGGRYNDMEMLINHISDNHLNLTLTYYARNDGERIILHGAFKRSN